MAPPVLKYISEEEYLEKERVAESKHEYFKGELVAMSGASLEHNRILSNIIRKAGNLLEGEPSEIFPSDLRVVLLRNKLLLTRMLRSYVVNLKCSMTGLIPLKIQL